MAEKIPDVPADVETERAVLGALLLDPALYPQVVAIVRPGDLYRPAHAAILEAMGVVLGRGESLDAVTVADELRRSNRLNTVGGLQYLGELTDATPTTAHVEAHARIVADLAQRRRVVAAARAAIERATRGGESWAGDVSRGLSAALESRADSVPLLTLRERAGHVAERVALRRRDGSGPGSRGLWSGLRALDRLTPGGLLPGQLIVVAGRPGFGKTSLFLQLALAAAMSGRGSALLFTLEMDTDELVERALCSWARVDSARAADGALTPAEAEALFRAVPHLERLPVLFDPRSRLRMSDIRARVLSARAAGERSGVPLAFVGVDYLQLLTADGDESSREEAISAQTRECKLLAKEAGVPLVLLSQFNRANERDGRAPRISDLRGSGAIEQDADKVWMIHSEADGADPVPSVDIIVGKQRKGPLGAARVQFVRALTAFQDVATEAEYEDTDTGEWR